MQSEPVGPVAEHVRKVIGQSKSTEKLKERGLYVDYQLRGKILLPSQIGEKAARKQIKIVREALAFSDSALSENFLWLDFEAVECFDGRTEKCSRCRP